MLIDRLLRVVRNVFSGAVTIAVALIFTEAAAQAQQFVLVDDTFTFTKADADKDQSHHYNRAIKQPATNWTMPVDYRKGTVHIRTEVIEKPAGGEITQWSICYFGNNGNSYGCSESGTYTQQGAVIDRDVGMLTWWQNETIDWTKGVKQVAFVMKDKNEPTGHTHKRSDPEHFFPTKVRITMVQVPAGGTYDASKAGLPAASGGDGGVADAQTTPDAGPDVSVTDAPAAGGSSGSGGATASGGSGGGATGGGAGEGGKGATGGTPATGGAGPAEGSGGSSASGGAPAGGKGGGKGTGSGGSTGASSESPGAGTSSAPGCAMAAVDQRDSTGLGCFTAVIFGLGLAITARRRRRLRD